jgi:predicted transcriptional regulator
LPINSGMGSTQDPRGEGGSRADELLIDRFLVAFNQIQQCCRDQTGAPETASFVQMVGDFLRHHPRRVDMELLRSLAEIRNILVHQKTRLHRDLAMPTPETVELIERIRDQFVRPARAEGHFRRVVQTVEADTSVLEAMRLISQTDYTQFPVYQGRDFKGLLTSHGITHWLAQLNLEGATCALLKQAAVGDVLAFERERLDRNCRIVARDMPVDEIVALFHAHPDLVAVLITEHGRQNERPVGIVTTWDVIETI